MCRDTPNVQGHNKMCRDTPNVQGHNKMCRDTQNCTRTHQTVKGYAYMYIHTLYNIMAVYIVTMATMVTMVISIRTLIIEMRPSSSPEEGKGK